MKSTAVRTMRRDLLMSVQSQSGGTAPYHSGGPESADLCYCMVRAAVVYITFRRELGVVMSDDLSHVLHFISRRQLANDKYTRGFLEAGLGLIESQFFAAEGDRDSGPLTFNFLSRRRVIQAVPDGLGTEGRFKDRWECVPHYLGDLTLYALREITFQDRMKLAEEAADALGSDRISRVVHEVTSRDLRLLEKSKAMRFLFFFTALAGREPLIREALSKVHSGIEGEWVSVYTKFFRVHNNFQLRVTVEKFATILSSIADGLTLRSVCDGPTSECDSEPRHVSLLGTAALALMVGLVDWERDGRTIEETADTLVGWS